MAKAPATNTVPQTAAERLAAYRRAAATLQPAQQQGPERAAAEVVGKAAADFRNFFTNTAAVYKVERQLGRMQ